LSEEEFFEEEVFEEEEVEAEAEVEEYRREEEMPMHELARMTDIINLMRSAIRGEISETEYKDRLKQLFHENISREESARPKSSKSHKRKGTPGKKP